MQSLGLGLGLEHRLGLGLEIKVLVLVLKKSLDYITVARTTFTVSIGEEQDRVQDQLRLCDSVTLILRSKSAVV